VGQRKTTLEDLVKVKVLIAGSSGFIGSNVVRYFIDENIEVHALLRKTSSLWRIRDIIRDLNIHHVDLSSYNDTEDIIKGIRPDAVINCSGIVSGFGLDDQSHVVQSNLVNTINLVNASLRVNVERFINTGSAYECGFSPIPLNKNCSGEPIGLYGITKKAEDEYIKMISGRYSRNYITARLFTPYGPFDKDSKLIPHGIISCINGKPIYLKNPNDGRDFVAVNDVAKIYYLLIKNLDVSFVGHSVNIGTGILTKVSEVTSLISGIFGMGDQFALDNDPEIGRTLFANLQEMLELERKLSFHFIDLKSGLNETVKWFKDNINKYNGTNQ